MYVGGIKEVKDVKEVKGVKAPELTSSDADAGAAGAAAAAATTDSEAAVEEAALARSQELLVSGYESPQERILYTGDRATQIAISDFVLDVLMDSKVCDGRARPIMTPPVHLYTVRGHSNYADLQTCRTGIAKMPNYKWVSRAQKRYRSIDVSGKHSEDVDVQIGRAGIAKLPIYKWCTNGSVWHSKHTDL